MIYFRNSFLVTVVGLALGAYLGWQTSHSWTGALSTMFIVAVLATLEVRRSNEPAINLYRSFGFRPVGVRPNYYADEGEDAIVMVLDF